ncbi:MAG: glycoside hydrolase [Bacteroidota bacterium]
MRIFLSCLFVLHVCIFNTRAQVGNRIINADLNQVTGKRSTVFNECIGAGRANEGLRADWQQQLTMVQKDINFKYIRMHGLLHDDMRVFVMGKDSIPVYNWQYIDKLYDFLLSIHIKPIVELSFMPNDMASATKTVFWWKGNVTKPKSYKLWDELIRRLTLHLQERYGKAEVEKWYFEVWNEPDLGGFFAGTQADYFELYAHTAKAVKSVSASYRIGGPATSAIKWIDDFLKYCDNNKLPVDFVTTHDYATTSVLDEFGTKKQKLKADADTVAKNVKKVRGQINNSAYKNAEFHLTEWNTSPSSHDPIHDSYQNAAFILNVLKKAMPYANSMSYWTFTDIFEEAGPAVTPFHGGFGLVNLENIKKPTYYAYQYLNSLGATELKNTDPTSIICKQDKNVQALFWDFTFPETGRDFDQGYFIKDQPPLPRKSVQLKLNNLANGTYTLQVYKTGYRANDPYSQYIAWGRPSYITPQQVTQLSGLSSGNPIQTTNITVKNGTYSSEFAMRSNDIYLVKLNFKHK